MPGIIISSRDKVRAHRVRLRAQGLRPMQIWVPDINTRAFVAAARMQSRAVAASSRAKADQAFIDSWDWLVQRKRGSPLQGWASAVSMKYLRTAQREAFRL